MPGPVAPFYPHTCFSLIFTTPSFRSFLPDLLPQKEITDQKKQSYVSAFFVFPLHTHSSLQSQGRIAEEFYSSQSKAQKIILNGLHMLSLAGTLPSRWNILGGQDTSLYGTSAKRCFPGTYGLMKFWQTFIAKSYSFISFYRMTLPFLILPHILNFRSKTWPYYIFSICWKKFIKEAELLPLANNLLSSGLNDLK